MPKPHASRGRTLVGLVVWVLVLALAWGCASQGDPFHAVEATMPVGAITPQDGAANVSPEIAITIAVPLDLEPRTVNPENVLLLDYHVQDQLPLLEKDKRPIVVPAKLVYDSARRVITLFPSQPLAESGRFQIVVQGLKSTSDVLFATTVTTFFTGTSATPAPTVLAIAPVPGQAMVVNTTPITITFSRVMDRTSTLAALSVAPGIAGTATFVDGTRTTLTFTPAAPYPAATVITVTVRPDAKDITGRPLERGFVSSFTVEAPPRVIPELTDPFNGQVSVPRSTAVTVVFSTLMTTSTVAQAFNLFFGSTFLGQGDGTFRFETSGSPARTVATFQPANPLPATTNVTIRVNNTARSTRGVPLEPIFTSVFQTAP